MMATMMATMFAAGSELDLPTLKTSFILASVLFQYPVMIIVPIILGLWLSRRLSIPRWVWGVGMATFVASQVVHIPLNFVLGIGGGIGPIAHAPLAVQAIAVGLTSGLCEEVARYIAMRWMVKKQSGWATSMVFGAGHGGVESILFGIGAAFGLLFMMFLPHLGDIAKEPSVQAGAWSYSIIPWYHSVYAGVERVGAVMAHIGLSVLVMRAVTRRNIFYLIVAILVHAGLNALILPLTAAGVDMIWLEAAGLVVGGALLATGLILREREPIG